MNETTKDTLLNGMEIGELNNLLSAFYLYTDSFPVKVLETEVKYTPKEKISELEAFGLEAIFLQVIQNYLVDTCGHEETETWQLLYDTRQSFCFNSGTLNILNEYPIDNRYSFHHIWIAEENDSVYAEIYDEETDSFISAHII